MTHGEFLVTGVRQFRGHMPGTVFEIRLDYGGLNFAVQRGDIRLLRKTTPALEPGSFTLPRGWLTSSPSRQPRGAERRLSH